MIKIEINKLLDRSVGSLPNEIWEEVPGFNGNYLISQYSRVKSVINNKEIILRKTLSSGKNKVTLCKKGKLINYNVGRLCASVHLRTPEENEVIRYKDGNQLNDQVSNLEWISRKKSVNDTLEALRRDNKAVNSGVRNGAAVINKQKAEEIRTLKRSGRTYKQLSNMYGVSVPCIQKVVQNRSWK